MRTLASGYAVICPGATLTSRYTGQGKTCPSILEALVTAAGQTLVKSAYPDGSIRLPKAFMMSEGDNKAACEGLATFLNKHQNHRINIGLIPIERSLRPEKQVNYDWIGQYRTEFQLRSHEVPFHIMDLDNENLQLYTTKSVHFRPEIAREAICQVVAAALQAMDAKTTPQPGARPSIHVLLCCSWNTVKNTVHKEMLATRALTRADTLSALLAEAAQHAGESAAIVYALGGHYLTAQPPLRVFQTYVHDSQPGPHEMMEECFPNIPREFFDDAKQVEIMKELSGMVGHCLYHSLTNAAHRADVWRYTEHWLRGGMYIDIKTRFVVTYRTLISCIMNEWTSTLSRQAQHKYGWINPATGPPDYFLTAIGAKKDHIFQGILLGRRRHPLMTSALHHCLANDFVRREHTPSYMTFCKVLFQVIKDDLGLASTDLLTPGWHLCPRLGPIYLLQEEMSTELRQNGPYRNDGHFFTTKTGKRVALTRCWQWRHGWKNDPGTQQAQENGILRNLPTALQEGQQTRTPDTVRGDAVSASSQIPTAANAVLFSTRHLQPEPGMPTQEISADKPTVTLITAHVTEAMETNLLQKILQQLEAFPQYYGTLELRDVQALIPRGLSINPDTLYLQCAFCKNKHGNNISFSNDAGIKQHFARQGWHANSAIKFSEALDHKTEAEFTPSTPENQSPEVFQNTVQAKPEGTALAASSSSSAGTQRPPEPTGPPPGRDATAYPDHPRTATMPPPEPQALPTTAPPEPPQVFPPVEQERPYESAGVPPPPPQRPLTMQEQCSDQGFQEWVKTASEVQVITNPQVMGLLTAGEWAKIWQRRLDILREPPRVMQSLHRAQTATGLTWQVLMTAKVTIGPTGAVTISTLREGHWVELDSPTRWIGGLHAIIKAAVQEGFKIHTDQDAEDYTIFAATFSTIYDLTSKRVNGTAKVSYHIKQGPQREAHFTIKHNDWTKNPSSRATQPAQPRGLRRPREEAGEDSQTQWDKRSGWSWKGHNY